MFCMLKKKNISTYVSKHNSKCENQVIPLMIPNEEGKLESYKKEESKRNYAFSRHKNIRI